MSNIINKLDAANALQELFSEARLKLSNRIKAEIRLPDPGSPYNSAELSLIIENMICTITIFGGGYINITEEVYGNIEYIVIDITTGSNLTSKSVILEDFVHLGMIFNDYLDDFIKLSTDL